MIDPTRRIRPPGGVRFACWMIGIGAFFLCLGGVLLLFVDIDPRVLLEFDVGQGIFRVAGFIMLAIGLFEFLLIYALSDGSRFARVITTVLVGLSLLGALGQAFAGRGGFLGIIQIGISIAILIGLWGTPDATEFFARDEEAVPAAPPPTDPGVPPRPD